MINPFKQVDWNPEEGEKKKFALSLCVGFPIIALVLYILRVVSIGFLSSKQCLYLGLGGFGLGMFLWVMPQVSTPIYFIWYAAACSIGFIVSNTLFALFYYFIITPLGCVMRMTGRDALNLRPDSATSTHWRDHEEVQDPKRYYRQY